mgnify:CR=1 FL=1
MKVKTTYIFFFVRPKELVVLATQAQELGIAPLDAGVSPVKEAQEPLEELVSLAIQAQELRVERPFLGV